MSADLSAEAFTLLIVECEGGRAREESKVQILPIRLRLKIRMTAGHLFMLIYYLLYANILH